MPDGLDQDEDREPEQTEPAEQLDDRLRPRPRQVSPREPGERGDTAQERLHFSQPATSARLRRLEEAGVISGYAARITPESVGLTISAIIRLRTTHAQIARALEQFGSLPEVTRILRVTGEDCFVLDVHARDAGRLEEVIDAIGRFGPVSTSLVLREYPAQRITPAL